MLYYAIRLGSKRPPHVRAQIGYRFRGSVPRAHGRRLGDRPSLSPTPRRFITAAVNLPMVAAAEGYGELIADLAAKRTALREPQVVGIHRLAATDQASLLGDVAHVVAISDPARLR